MHFHPDTIIEEKSCINPKTGRSLPTDIVNHRLKIAIEVQSRFHDANRRKRVDDYKKSFWINKGYSFYDPDIRDYTILDMIQLFFPDVCEVPSYVRYNFSNCIDHVPIQEMLNNGLTIKEISSITGIKQNTIRGLANDKKIVLPVGYIERVFNIKPIVRLDKNGGYMERFSSLNEIERNGFAVGSVRRVLVKEQNYSYDSYWVYEDDYLSGKYSIPIPPVDRFSAPVSKTDLVTGISKHYNSIYDAEKDSRSSKSEILRVAKGDRRSSRSEVWKFIN